MYSGLFLKKKDFFDEHILANFDLSKIAQGRFETDGEVERKDLTQERQGYTSVRGTPTVRITSSRSRAVCGAHDLISIVAPRLVCFGLRRSTSA
jgi:hypothetical protein